MLFKETENVCPNHLLSTPALSVVSCPQISFVPPAPTEVLNKGLLWRVLHSSHQHTLAL